MVATRGQVGSDASATATVGSTTTTMSTTIVATTASVAAALGQSPNTTNEDCVGGMPTQ